MNRNQKVVCGTGCCSGPRALSVVERVDLPAAGTACTCDLKPPKQATQSLTSGAADLAGAADAGGAGLPALGRRQVMGGGVSTRGGVGHQQRRS